MGRFYKSAETYYDEMQSTLKDVDNSEHSFIYHANKPVAFEMSYQSMLLDEVEKKIHAKTALENGYYEDLIKICADMNINQKEASKATGVVILTGNAGSKFPAGAIFSKTTSITYINDTDIIIGDDGTAIANITASDYGSKYNCEIGEINSFPVKYEGILSVTNEVAITNGYDVESYESLYNRYLLKVQTPATSGNKYHYEQWALEVTGVGGAKCIPSEELGKGGVVKVIISNSNKRAASEELIQETYKHIDEVRPVLPGTLEVVTVKEISINITGNVEIDTSVTLGGVQETFRKLIQEYLDDKVYITKKISIAKIQAILIDIDGVTDCGDIKINKSMENISLALDEIAVLGNVELGVI